MPCERRLGFEKTEESASRVFFSDIFSAYPQTLDFLVQLCILLNTNSTTSVLTGRGGAFIYLHAKIPTMIKRDVIAVYIDGSNTYRRLKDLEIPNKSVRFDLSAPKQSKTIKFTSFLADLILEGGKTTTWRLFDDKNLQIGDLLNFQLSETGKDFAKAKITGLKEKTLAEVNEADYGGHEKYESQVAMLNQFKKFYGDRVSIETTVKIIRFNLEK